MESPYEENQGGFTCFQKEEKMRNLIKDLLNSKLSRRGFIAGMVAAGYSASAANSALQSVAPLVPGVVAPASFTRSVTGTGGELMIEQLIEAGARYMFVANASGLGAMCDALVTRPQIQLIQATQEGQAVSIADGYARASGKIGFAMYSRVGLPHSTSNMYNAMKDRTPLVLLSDHADSTSEGHDAHALLVGQLHQLCRRKDSVGGGAVAVKVGPRRHRERTPGRCERCCGRAASSRRSPPARR